MSELLAGLDALLADRVGRIWVAGEIRNLHRAPSGHTYFSLSDDRGQIRAVLFRAAARRLLFEPEDGLEVLALAEASLYAPRGELQLRVAVMEPRGRGALQLAFEQLRRRLEAEGLFDPARKRPLPEVPRRVGVVTSRGAAALRDVLEVAGERFPSVPLLLAPAGVQGAGAPAELAAALAALDAQPDVDVILLVRGGGPPEDLQAFNQEAVVRAIAGCRKPVVSGVGHEVDVTLADLAADVRAATPSAAAALAVPHRRALGERLARDARRLRAGMLRRLDRAAGRLDPLGDVLRAAAPSARLATQRQQLASAARALGAAAEARLARDRGRLERAAARLLALSPLAVLARGYAIARRADDGRVVRHADQVAPGDQLRVRVAAAELDARVEGARPLATAASASASSASLETASPASEPASPAPEAAPSSPETP